MKNERVSLNVGWLPKCCRCGNEEAETQITFADKSILNFCHEYVVSAMNPWKYLGDKAPSEKYSCMN